MIRVITLQFFYRQLLLNHKQDTIMKKRILALGCLATLFAFGSEAQAATATADASAKIVGAISISKNAGAGNDLAFGTIFPGDGGRVMIKADEYNSVDSEGVTLVNSKRTSAKFTVGGTSGMICSIDIPKEIKIKSDTDAMLVELVGSANVITLPGDPAGSEYSKAPLYVGGTLHVSANQPMGEYKSTFDVTVAYQ
jgi:hypothetical protein